MGTVLDTNCLTSTRPPKPGYGGVMDPRTVIVETRVYRRGRNRDVLCRLTYQVTPHREGLFRWFLVAIEELE